MNGGGWRTEGRGRKAEVRKAYAFRYGVGATRPREQPIAEYTEKNRAFLTTNGHESTRMPKSTNVLLGGARRRNRAGHRCAVLFIPFTTDGRRLTRIKAGLNKEAGKVGRLPDLSDLPVQIRGLGRQTVLPRMNTNPDPFLTTDEHRWTRIAIGGQMPSIWFEINNRSSDQGAARWGQRALPQTGREGPRVPTYESIFGCD
jgi:hypothetical protein